jgi:2-polyprenyl-3-methyl-5-hydroxy-6-metoxy-1,4-benzoquinol methylase
MDWTLIQEYLARTVSASARVLDFGCHTGGLLKRLGARYARIGVEVNEAAARIARQESGAEVVASLGALPRAGRFDVVIAADVIEHFHDPGEVLHSLLEVLEPGGALIVTTGDADALLWRITGARWWYCFYPEHLAFISERWVRDWLRRTESRARLVDAKTFRRLRLSPLRFAVQSGLLLACLAAPRIYAEVGGRVRRMLGRDATVYPPGSGVTRDHVFLALRKTA